MLFGEKQLLLPGLFLPRFYNLWTEGGILVED